MDDNELFDDDSNGPPDDENVLQSNTQSEVQLCVQRMLGQQLDTDISLEQYAVKHKSFTPAVTFRSFIEQASGQLSLEQFEVLEKEHQGLDELRACGLSDQEIALKLENEGSHLSSVLPPSKRGSFLADPIARKKRLMAVEGKIQQRQKALGLTSEEYPTEHNQEESKDTAGREQCGEIHPASSRLLVKHPTTLGLAYIHPDDPINHLDDIAAGLFGKSKDKQVEDVSASAENATSPVWGSTGEFSTGCCGDKCCSGEMVLTHSEGFLKETLEDAHRGGLSQGCSSMSEGKSRRQDSVLTNFTETDSHGSISSSEIRNLTNTPHVGSSPEGKSKTEISNHAVGDFGTGLESQSADPRVPRTCGSGQGMDNEPRRLASVVIPLSREELLKHRLRKDDICKMERFKDYSTGQPSKVLFLKNLASKVTEEDLASVFMSFQHQDKPKVVFKLLKGRMKGQAFVTFADAETASEALSHVNGYPLRGKPVIIQYGKQR